MYRNSRCATIYKMYIHVKYLEDYIPDFRPFVSVFCVKGLSRKSILELLTGLG
jgi:hypothetical protein